MVIIFFKLPVFVGKLLFREIYDKVNVGKKIIFINVLLIYAVDLLYLDRKSVV